MAITAAPIVDEHQTAFYREHGYLQLNDVLTHEEIDELGALTDEMNEQMQKDLPPLKERAKYQQVFLQVVNVWRRDERFRKFTLHPRLAEAARGKRPHEIQRVYVPLRKGSITFHSGSTFHFAGRNLTDRPRKALAVIYMADGSTFEPVPPPPGHAAGKGHPVTDEAGYLKPGDAFCGEFFPIIV